MKLNLFIGHHKSGSSSIQRYLAINSQLLIEKGFLYPFADLISILCAQHTSLHNTTPATPGSLQARINALANGKNFLEPHNGLAFTLLHEATGSAIPPWHAGLPTSSEEIFRLLHEQLEASEAHTLLIASEVLANFSAVDNGLILRLLKQLPPGERRLLAILRRPDDYLHSWYCQELCFGYPRMATLAERLDNVYLESIHVNYALMLRGWIESNAFDDLELRNYRDLRANGGSVQWFLESVCLGGTTLANNRHETWANPSLHPAFANLARKANTELPQRQALDLIRMLKQLGTTDGLPPAANVELLGSSGRHMLCEHFEPINTYLGKLVGVPRFFSDSNKMTDLRPLLLHEIEPEAAQIAANRLGTQLTFRQRMLLEDWANGSGITKLR